MKKTILISSGTFLMGGVERALVEYLNLIDLTKYRVILFMDSDLGELNVLEKGVPNEIEVILHSIILLLKYVKICLFNKNTFSGIYLSFIVWYSFNL